MRKNDLETLVIRLRDDLKYLEKRFDGTNYQTTFGYLEKTYVTRNEYESLKDWIKRNLAIHEEFINGLVEIVESSGIASTCNQCGQKLPWKKDN